MLYFIQSLHLLLHRWLDESRNMNAFLDRIYGIYKIIATKASVPNFNGLGKACSFVAPGSVMNGVNLTGFWDALTPDWRASPPCAP